MELWVRSQNKTELMRVVDLDIYDAREPKTYVIESRGIILGNYKTKERALEVLDEIQKILSLKDMYKYDKEIVLKGWENFSPNQIQTIRQQMSVYEMPRE